MIFQTGHEDSKWKMSSEHRVKKVAEKKEAVDEQEVAVKEIVEEKIVVANQLVDKGP